MNIMKQKSLFDKNRISNLSLVFATGRGIEFVSWYVFLFLGLGVQTEHFPKPGNILQIPWMRNIQNQSF